MFMYINVVKGIGFMHLSVSDDAFGSYIIYIATKAVDKIEKQLGRFVCLPTPCSLECSNTRDHNTILI
jgi:hypothetical protein